MRKLIFVKGIVVGIAKIIPGFSGAVLMISFNLYDRVIRAITNFCDDVKNNFWLLLKFGLGVLIGIVLFSRVVEFFLKYYYLYTMIFFIGLILGGISAVIGDISFNRRNLFWGILCFFIVMFLSFGNSNFSYLLHYNMFDYIVFFFAGVCEAIGTVLPGVSSTALLMLIGVYSYYISVIGNLFSFSLFLDNLSFLLPFSLGLFVGIIILSFFINYLFCHYKEQTFSSIFGFSLASVFLLIIRLFPFVNNFFDIFICLLFLFVGYVIANNL